MLFNKPAYFMCHQGNP